MATCLKHQQTYGDYSQCPQCLVFPTVQSTPGQKVSNTLTPTGGRLKVENVLFRIDHARRHIASIQQELKRVFPRKRVIEQEMLQIVIRLTDQLEVLIKEGKE